ncbi:MAG: nitroreductase family protein [Ilumatobacteraceae bacterium]
MELRRAIESRRMTRDFDAAEIADDILSDLVDLASRAPSAGKTQGWSLLVLRGAARDEFWNMSLPIDKRAGFAWPGLLRAPVVALSFADPDAYVARYSEPDKVHTGLGGGADKWGAPYWTIDASMATMTFLLAAHDAGLGALFFAVFNREDEIRAHFGVPRSLQLLGAIALGYPAVNSSRLRRGASATRPRRGPTEIIHLDRW